MPQPRRAPGRRPHRPSKPTGSSGRTRVVGDARRPGGRPDDPGITLEVTFLPGLEDVVADELRERLRLDRPPVRVPGREDAWLVRHAGPLRDVRGVRTAVAAYLVLHFDVPRPKSLTSGDHLARIVAACYDSLRVAGSSSFRFEAAGSDSAVFARLAELVHQATGLQYDERAGELVLRVRRGAKPARAAAPDAHDRSGPRPDPGWDVLVRVGPRPLSARAWRVADFPGAANATIAAAMVRLAGVRPDDRVANLMCGSGTLLVERLLAGPAAVALGVDLDPAALEAAAANVEAAGLTRRVTVVRGDATDPARLTVPAGSAPPDEPARPPGFDLLLADPPWGTLHGSHATNAALLRRLLAAAHAAAAPGARLVVLTHEIRLMEAALRDAAGLWTSRETVRVFAKGHHPRIYVLDRVA